MNIKLMDNLTEEEKEIITNISRKDLKQIAYALSCKLQKKDEIKFTRGEIPIDKISTDLYYTSSINQRFIDKTLEELKEHGVFKKKVYVLKEKGSDYYSLIEGFRVLCTAQLIGIKEIEVIIVESKLYRRIVKKIKRTEDKSMRKDIRKTYRKEVFEHLKSVYLDDEVI